MKRVTLINKHGDELEAHLLDENLVLLPGARDIDKFKLSILGWQIKEPRKPIEWEGEVECVNKLGVFESVGLITAIMEGKRFQAKLTEILEDEG